MIYDSADAAIRAMNREDLRAFGRLKTMRFDELHVIREVTAVYDTAALKAKKRYRKVAYDSLVEALILCGWTSAEARRDAEKILGEKWVRDWLGETDPVVRYQFDPEKDRKKQRLIESLAVKPGRDAEIDRALKEWSRQTGHFAIAVTDRARLDAFRHAGVEEVEWVTERDARVCRYCRSLDGKRYPIGKVPGKAHMGCRCHLMPVLD